MKNPTAAAGDDRMSAGPKEQHQSDSGESDYGTPANEVIEERQADLPGSAAATSMMPGAARAAAMMWRASLGGSCDRCAAGTKGGMGRNGRTMGSGGCGGNGN